MLKVIKIFIKVGLSPTKKIVLFASFESLLKMIYNAFYFIFLFQLFLFSRYLSFCHDFLSCWKNGLIREIRLMSKIMTSQPGEETITIHILPNISWSKMKLGQLIDYIKKNVFFKKSCRKKGTETSSRPLFVY